MVFHLNFVIHIDFTGSLSQLQAQQLTTSPGAYLTRGLGSMDPQRFLTPLFSL